MYVTRECIKRIGLMDDLYFLYWEDVRIGASAPRPHSGIGYAHGSVVPHISGSASGTSNKRAERSAFTVYLGNRNKLHFVRQHYPGWSRVDSVRIVPQNRRSPGSRIDAQFRRCE